MKSPRTQPSHFQNWVTLPLVNRPLSLRKSKDLQNSKQERTGCCGIIFIPQVLYSTWHTGDYNCHLTFCTRTYDMPRFVLEILFNCKNSKTYSKERTQIMFCSSFAIRDLFSHMCHFKTQNNVTKLERKEQIGTNKLCFRVCSVSLPGISGREVLPYELIAINRHQGGWDLKWRDQGEKKQGTGRQKWWGSLRQTDRLQPTPTPGGIHVVLLRHCWLPKNKGKGKKKWLTDRDHCAQYLSLPTIYKYFTNINSPISRNRWTSFPGASASPLHSAVEDKNRRKWQTELNFLVTCSPLTNTWVWPSKLFLQEVPTVLMLMLC